MKLTVAKSWYISGGFEPIAQSDSRNVKYIRAESTYMTRSQCVFGTESFGSDKKPKNIFMWLRSNDSDGEGFGVGSGLLLFRVEARHNAKKTQEELSFVKYMECTEVMDKFDKVLKYVCLRVHWTRLTTLRRKKGRMRRQRLVSCFHQTVQLYWRPC